MERRMLSAFATAVTQNPASFGSLALGATLKWQ